ncbi:MAG: tRNA threonylcarbamoyladenosine biosynthesis protein RimN [Moraxellaceae bacterium]|nr:MAG: tRNA threonylcarbamoyladenosine biosynthesis protein RimN [Moraxellaceae bacterium]
MINWSLNPRIRYAATQLWQGGVVAYPTEAVWGLGCNPFNEQAVMRLLELKDRPVGKGLILVAAGIEYFEPFISHLNDIQRQRIKNTWPGPVTWLVPKNELVPKWISGDYTGVALRVTNHPVAAGLSRAFGAPIVSTSCNLQGRPPAKTAFDVRKYFGDDLDAITSGTVGDSTSPSEIRDLMTGQIVRPG